eukprot:760557-Hanusia_phi.AAC.4
MVLGMVAVSLLDGSHLHHTELGFTAGITSKNKLQILTKDLKAAQAKVQKFLDSLAAENAGSIRGSVATDEAEASAIMNENGADMEKNMPKPYRTVDGSHSDPSSVADAIIKQVDKDNIDVTGKAGEITYQQILKQASEGDPFGAAWVKGSLPNYDAEASFITKDVSGNFEKELENDPVIKVPTNEKICLRLLTCALQVAGGKVSARTVADAIVDEATKDKNDIDCFSSHPSQGTGVVDGTGIHGIGHGSPPCTTMAKVVVSDMLSANARSVDLLCRRKAKTEELHT